MIFQVPSQPLAVLVDLGRSLEPTEQSDSGTEQSAFVRRMTANDSDALLGEESSTQG